MTLKGMDIVVPALSAGHLFVQPMWKTHGKDLKGFPTFPMQEFLEISWD